MQIRFANCKMIRLKGEISTISMVDFLKVLIMGRFKRLKKVFLETDLPACDFSFRQIYEFSKKYGK